MSLIPSPDQRRSNTVIKLIRKERDEFKEQVAKLEQHIRMLESYENDRIFKLEKENKELREALRFWITPIENKSFKEVQQMEATAVEAARKLLEP